MYKNDADCNFFVIFVIFIVISCYILYNIQPRTTAQQTAFWRAVCRFFVHAELMILSENAKVMFIFINRLSAKGTDGVMKRCFRG